MTIMKTFSDLLNNLYYTNTLRIFHTTFVNTEVQQTTELYIFMDKSSAQNNVLGIVKWCL